MEKSDFNVITKKAMLNSFFLRNYRYFIVAIVVLLSAILYLSSSKMITDTGYPLDDAWIHQTYARNLAVNGEWAFLPGQVSGGSTSPLWTILLIPGYWLGIPQVWTYMLGIICLIGVAILAMVNLQMDEKKPAAIFLLAVGLFFATEWHLLWASVSGMETIFYISIIMLFFVLLKKQNLQWVSGILIGVAVWIRPDGLLLLGPWIWVILLSKASVKEKISSLWRGLAVFSAIFGLYLTFNYFVAGTVWPNTFYAKQTEYSILKETPYYLRYIKEFSLPWIGASSVLLPGFLIEIINIGKRKDVNGSASLLWAIGYLGVYAFMLPVTYQHGRYIMPAMPVLFLLSLHGFNTAVQRLQNAVIWQRIMKNTWIAVLVSLAAIFLVKGANAYAEDVAIINTEMVATAKWVSINTAKEALIASHDIGALGYYGQRSIIDLAGLITPEVVPFMRDEERLAEYLDQKQVDYLITFPGWYPVLASMGTPVYDSNGGFSPNAGGENMIVFLWKK
jgi:hypothetical protein